MLSSLSKCDITATKLICKTFRFIIIYLDVEPDETFVSLILLCFFLCQFCISRGPIIIPKHFFSFSFFCTFIKLSLTHSFINLEKYLLQTAFSRGNRCSLSLSYTHVLMTHLRYSNCINTIHHLLICFVFEFSSLVPCGHVLSVE